MSVLSRKTRLSDRIPVEVLTRAREAGVVSPSWYAGRLEGPGSPEGHDVTPDPDLEQALLDVAEQHRSHPGRDTVRAGVTQMREFARAVGRLLHISHS